MSMTEIVDKYRKDSYTSEEFKRCWRILTIDEIEKEGYIPFNIKLKVSYTERERLSSFPETNLLMFDVKPAIKNDECRITGIVDILLLFETGRRFNLENAVKVSYNFYIMSCVYALFNYIKSHGYTP